MMNNYQLLEFECMRRVEVSVVFALCKTYLYLLGTPRT